MGDRDERRVCPQSEHFSTEYGLMINDPLIVALMQGHKLVHLATNDRDFKQVQCTKIWTLAE